MCTNACANLSRFRKIHFIKLSRDDKIKIEEAMYQIMWTFKKVPIEFIGLLPSKLRISIDQRWTCHLVTKRQMRDAQLAQLFTKLKLDVVKRNVESYRKKFNQKARAFKILQGNSKELALQTR